jgi:hypothetical protein
MTESIPVFSWEVGRKIAKGKKERRKEGKEGRREGGTEGEENLKKSLGVW